MNTLPVGSLAAYDSIESGTVKGKITNVWRDRFGVGYTFTVTTAGNVAYPKGYTFNVGASEHVSAR